MPLPPWSEVWDALRFLIAPTLAASLLVMIVGRYLTGERFSIFATALALAAGVVAGNYFREDMPWRIDSDRPLTVGDLREVLGWSLEGKPPAESSETDQDKKEPTQSDDEKKEPIRVPQSTYWLFWLAGLAMLVELLARFATLPPSIWWTIRALVAVFAGRLLTPADLRVEHSWTPWALGIAMLLEWAILQSLAQRWKDGTLGAALSICFAAAGIVILHAHSGRLTDMALLFSVALFPIALFAWIRPSETGGALGAVAVFLPGLLLNSMHDTVSDVPWRSFLFAGLAPIALLPMLHARLVRQTRWGRWVPGIILPLIPSIWAVVLAAEAEKLQFEHEQKETSMGQDLGPDMNLTPFIAPDVGAGLPACPAKDRPGGLSHGPSRSRLSHLFSRDPRELEQSSGSGIVTSLSLTT